MPIPDGCIASASYDPETATLAIDFQHGGSYVYSFVPPEIYAGLLAGGGEFFNSAIRDVFPAHRGSSQGGLRVLDLAVKAAELLAE
jgi:hypothetical protein